MVVVGHMSFPSIEKYSDYALSAAAEIFLGRSGFLLIFMAVNIANFKLANETRSSGWISLLAALSCLGALAALCCQTWEEHSTQRQLLILVAIIASSFIIEVIYRQIKKREIHMERKKG